jgi:hypothetical protein
MRLMAADEILSKSAFAVRRSVSPAAVTNWIVRQWLTPPALRPDGRVNVALAEKQLAAPRCRPGPRAAEDRGGAQVPEPVGAFVAPQELPSLAAALHFDRG